MSGVDEEVASPEEGMIGGGGLADVGWRLEAWFGIWVELRATGEQYASMPGIDGWDVGCLLGEFAHKFEVGASSGTPTAHQNGACPAGHQPAGGEEQFTAWSPGRVVFAAGGFQAVFGQSGDVAEDDERR